LTLAIVTVIFNLHVFFVESVNMRLNAQILDAVMNEVERMRAERG
jgi:hypothetical protein